MKIISFRDIQTYPRGYFSLSFVLTTIEMECNNGKWDEERVPSKRSMPNNLHPL